jgi:hypothetical protein
LAGEMSPYLNASMDMRLLALLIFVIPFTVSAQQQTPPKKKTHFIKSALGNDYNFVGVKAHDHPGWNDGIFSKALSIPQYNYRLGFLLDEEKGWGFEINFDHTKYIFANQNVVVKGMLNHRQVDTTVAFWPQKGFNY